MEAQSDKVPRSRELHRVLWWDLGNHGRVPSATPKVMIECVRGGPIPLEDLTEFHLLIVEAHSIRQDETRESLISFLNSAGCPPALLVTALDPENARYFYQIPVEGFAWAFEPEGEVLDRALCLVTRTERRRLADHVLRACPDRDKVEPVVRVLFLESTPPSQVQDLALACHTGRRALERKWKAAWGGKPPVCLKSLMDWAVGLRARELGLLGRSPKEIAKALRIQERTLKRITDRLAGTSPCKWLELDSRAVRGRATEKLLNLG